MAGRSYLLKSSITRNLFNEFTTNYQTLELENYSIAQPFIYVDNDGSIKLLTDMVKNCDGDDDIFAVSVGEDGWMEYLAY